MKVDPRSIHADQRKKDTRRDAWDRDYMGYYYLKEEPKSNKQISNATPVFIFAFFYIAILVMIGSVKQKGFMTASYGIMMGVIGTIITVIGFFVAYKVASMSQEESKDLEQNNPITEFWKDYPGHKDKD